ncbi:HYR domain-containing protein [Aequorivita xiaoshiensis]|uniref:HYR domain-containing protein n=1 Tax=Aequorivita xiaoshiensis TaxID=2874476 RepID=A0A9X1R6D5_9FLAO|nr:HYR domain-containing protein [Aequorivita xiaoshiensis]MCG2431814.1 HYR domain-containing protein [Aequorivita xiaoshiensis]
MKKITFLTLMALFLTSLGWQANAQYCAAAGNSTTYEKITNVTFAGINNSTTVHPGYSDFTSMVASLSPGGTEQLSITIDPDGGDYLYAFIDWNQNGILDDAGEAYNIAGPIGSSGPHTLNITVPASASLGDTRMRIKLKWGASDPGPCGTFSFGEVEDYTVNVGSVVGNPPVISCPTDITAYTEAGVCTAAVNFSDAIAFDTEDGAIPTTQTAGPASGSDFPLGVTVVEYSATDSDGNTVTCQFEVNVIDDEAPVAVCQDITVDLDSVTGMASITGADIDNGSTDNCGIASYTLDISSFDCSMIGENTVTLTVTDNSGNSSTCTATVTVQDTTAPEVFCVGGFGNFSESEDFESSSVPAGWTTNIILGSQDWTFGSGEMPTGGDFPTNAAIFDDDAAGSEDNIAELISPVYDLTGATAADISFDYALQDFAGLGLLRAEVWDGAAWQEVFLADNADIDPTNTGAIDVTAYINNAFQVKFTFDDETGWNWGAGVDNFLLNYQAASGGGLDVYLDANGVASIDPSDLVTGVTEACGYTITAGGVGGGAQGSLTSLFASGNNGAMGGAVYFDITVGPSDLDVTEIDINTADPGAFTMDVYTLVGTYVGNETNAAAWGTAVAVGSGTGAGQDAPSNAVLDNPITLSANTTYGIALVLDATHAHYYTNGDGSNQNFSNDDMSMSLGAASNTPFTTPIFAPRVFNGTIHYETSGGSGLDFTCADLGENMVEVTVTDSSGNTATCTAVVNVIDNIAPVITCGVVPVTTELEEFEGSTIPSGWTTEVLSGNADWAFGSGDMPTGGDFPTNAAIFNDDAAGSGEVNLVSLISPAYDITGAVSASISFDYALQEFAGDGTLAVDVYDGAAWQQVFFVDVDTDPTNSGSIDVMPYANANLQVRFTFDDEGAWGWGAGVDNFEITYETSATGNMIDVALGADGTATIDPYALLSNIDEACGIDTIATDVTTVTCADIGTPVLVTVFVSDASGNVASCVAEVNVVDLLGPEITCPADQTVDPGVGNLYYIVPDYFATGEATAMDNCTDPVTITSQDPAPGAALPDGVHTITLTATDEYGNSSTCSFELTVETVLGANENSLDTGVTLYPNPASTMVNLVNKTNIALESMTIFDVSGKMVSEINLSAMHGEKAVDISTLATGVYVVQIVGDNVSTVKRLIVE